MKDNTSSEMGNLVRYLREFSSITKMTAIPQALLWWCVRSISMNDPAHNLGHVLDVCKLGNELCIMEGLEYDETLKVNLACLFHDLGCKYNRDDHHLIAYGMCYTVLEQHWPGQFTPDDIKEIAVAVLEHRSSNKDKPTSVISEIVSVADSGRPNIHVYIKRSLQYRISKGDLEEKGKDVLFAEVACHLGEKFGRDGYHWKSYPDLGKRYFAKEWAEFGDFLDSDPELITTQIENIFNQL